MKQHYVPKVYLKHFATKKDGDNYFVDVYDRQLGRHFNANTKNICAITDFYTLDEDNAVTKDILGIEKFYSEWLEPLYLKAYNILTNDSIINITDIDRATILIGVFQLYMRNPRILNKSTQFHRTEIIKLCNEAKRNGIKGITYLDQDFSFREWDEEGIIKYFNDKAFKLLKEQHISATKQICEYHQFVKFELNIISDDSYFITGDNPLVVEDIVTKDEHPLSKSKEFLIPLNHKYALRILHDNTLGLNTIHRKYIPSGNVGLINCRIFEQGSRFLIGAKEGIEDYFKISKILNQESLELKINSIRQVLDKCKITEDNKDLREVLKLYLNKYDKEGGLSDFDQQQLMKEVDNASVEFKKKNISIN